MSNSNATNPPAADAESSGVDTSRTPRRVRHELRFRALTVTTVQHLTPHLIRVTLGGDALEGFNSPGFDDHVKVFFPDAATGELRLPAAGPDGPVWGEGGKPVMRDYTPRYFDAAARTLDIEFAVHDAGPATDWAVKAQPGQQLGVGGPRGSFIIPTNFDAHLLVGDDTALPAIARRLAELPAGAPVVVVVEVDDEAGKIALEDGADVHAKAEVHWAFRRGAPAGQSTALLDTLRSLTLPQGDTYAWVACESSVAKAARIHLVQERGFNPKWVKAAGYWRNGTAATHDTHDD